MNDSDLEHTQILWSPAGHGHEIEVTRSDGTFEMRMPSESCMVMSTFPGIRARNLSYDPLNERLELRRHETLCGFLVVIRGGMTELVRVTSSDEIILL